MNEILLNLDKDEIQQPLFKCSVIPKAGNGEDPEYFGKTFFDAANDLHSSSDSYKNEWNNNEEGLNLAQCFEKGIAKVWNDNRQVAAEYAHVLEAAYKYCFDSKLPKWAHHSRNSDYLNVITSDKFKSISWE